MESPEYGEHFKKALQKMGLKDPDRYLESLDRWARSFNRTPTPNNKPLKRSPGRKIEVWESRLPHPDANIGKSGGFRVVFFIILEEDRKSIASLTMHSIEHRNKLGYKEENKKGKNKAQWAVADLYEHLLKVYEE